MDVYYMSDSIQYGSFRNPLYRDYEKFPYGTLENTLNSPPKSGGMQQNQQRNQTSSLVAGQDQLPGTVHQLQVLQLPPVQRLTFIHEKVSPMQVK
uniref:Uncharacterized protein n=1 Tax=Culex tarsalis TaxID=7177 RepID=A0A1Q3FCQ7_CULTA